MNVDGVDVRVQGDPKMMENPETAEALRELARAAIRKAKADAGDRTDGVAEADEENDG